VAQVAQDKKEVFAKVDGLVELEMVLVDDTPEEQFVDDAVEAAVVAEETDDVSRKIFLGKSGDGGAGENVCDGAVCKAMVFEPADNEVAGGFLDFG